MEYITTTLANLVHQTAFFSLTCGNLIMIGVACFFLFLAIRHGFEGIKEGGLLRVTACREQDSIHFQVQDNGKGMDQKTIDHFITEGMNNDRIGLSNVHRRLLLIYGKRYRVSVESAPGQGTLLNLYLPYEL